MDDLQQLRAAVARLNEVTTRQRTQLKALGDMLKLVNAKFQRTGTTAGPFAIGFQDVAITWPTPWPDTQYAVLISVVAGDNAITNLNYALKAGSKTNESCIVRVQALVAVGTFGIEVVGVRT